MEKMYIYIILVILIVIVISIIYSHIKIDVSKYIIKDKKIDKDISIVFLSDLHNRKLYNKIIDIINSINPDIILLGGDMINDGNNEYDHFFSLCNLLEKYKCYYTFGNHEDRLDEVCKKSFINLVSNNTKIKLLNNSSESLTENIVLYGLDNDIETYTFFGKKALDKEYITSKLGNIDEKKYNILLAHNPLEFASYVHYKANLVLSGHIHGGIVRIPFLKGVLSPDITFFPKYDSGEYNKDNTKMIVSRGLGFSKRIPFRVFNPAEIVVINLKKDL